MDFLKYSDITTEIKGCMTSGKLTITDQSIIFENDKTGKVEQIPSAELAIVNFQKFSASWSIRLFLKDGTLHRFVGFKNSEKEEIAKFFSTTYKIEILERELSVKGWNWGTAKFTGSILSFDIGDNTAFEIPLNYVSHCTADKNDITMEFHQNDDAPVSLMEMRFFVASNELAGDVDPVEQFRQRVMDKANVINVPRNAIAIFREIHCLTPRGRYDIKVFNTFFRLHGKTFDYKIPMTTVVRLFMLPHKDNRHMFFVISLDPPIKQGQTRYNFLVLLFNEEDETSVELPFTEEEIIEKYEGKLEKKLSGPTYEVLARIMRNIINRKVTGPVTFIGHSGTPAISCSLKAAAGLLYPLERGFIYVHKPPIHIRFEEITCVNFAREGGSTRSFDFEVELKSGAIHTFSSIEKEEYSKLFDFITTKKLNIKNIGKNDKASYKDNFGGSDDESAPDPYLQTLKAEAEARDDDQRDEDESTDEDFNPNQVESDVAEEFDSNHSSSSEEDEEGGSDSEEKEKKTEREKREKKKTKTVSEKPRKQKEKKEKDDNKPKRATSAFMLWLNENREKIKKDNEGIKVTEIAKKGGEMWRELKDKSEWEAKANKEKERYNKEVAEYKAAGGGQDKDKKPKKPATKKTASSPAKTDDLKIKSKEYIDDTDSSSDDEETNGDKKGSDTEQKKTSKGSDDDKRKKDTDDDKSKKMSTKGSDKQEYVEATPPNY